MGEIFIGPETHRLVATTVVTEPVASIPLRGRHEAVDAFRVVSLDGGPRERPARLETPMVGRRDELERLGASFEEVRESGSTRLVTIVGDPGVGKSRLVQEFVETVAATATVLRGRCLPYGDGITFWPLLEVVQMASGILDDDAPAAARDKIRRAVADAGDAELIAQRLAGLLGFDPEVSTLETGFWGARRFLETLAWETPGGRGVRRPPRRGVDLPGPGGGAGAAGRGRGRADPRPQPAGAVRGPPGLGHGRRPLGPAEPGPAHRRRERHAARAARPGRRASPGGPPADRRGRRGQPPVRGRGVPDAHRRRPAPPGGRPVGGRRRPGLGHGPADRPGAARDPPGPAAAVRAGRHRARVRGRQAVRRAHRVGPDPAGGAAAGGRAAAGPGAAGSGPPPGGALGGARHLALHPPADPRRGVPGDAQGDAGGPARGVRDVARHPRRRAGRGGRDRRLPPGAGTPVPGRARRRRGGGPRPGRDGRRGARVGGEPGHGPGRRAGHGQPARSRGGDRAHPLAPGRPGAGPGGGSGRGRPVRARDRAARVGARRDARRRRPGRRGPPAHRPGEDPHPDRSPGDGGPGVAGLRRGDPGVRGRGRRAGPGPSVAPAGPRVQPVGTDGRPPRRR